MDPSRQYQVLDHPHLIKDGYTRAVLNTDKSAVARHNERIVKVNKELQIDRDIQDLKNDMGDLKITLNLLLQAVLELKKQE